jgi:hypothetical protein
MVILVRTLMFLPFLMVGLLSVMLVNVEIGLY